MIYRLSLRAICLACLILAGAPLAADAQRSAFYSLSIEERRALQADLARTGLYPGPLDGLWGPGTAAAVARAQDRLTWPGFKAARGGVPGASEFAILQSFLMSPQFSAGQATRREPAR